MAAEAGYRTAGIERDNSRTVRFRRVVVDVFGRSVEPADKKRYTARIKHLSSAQSEAGVCYTPMHVMSQLSRLASRMIAGHIWQSFAT